MEYREHLEKLYRNHEWKHPGALAAFDDNEVTRAAADLQIKRWMVEAAASREDLESQKRTLVGFARGYLEDYAAGRFETLKEKVEARVKLITEMSKADIEKLSKELERRTEKAWDKVAELERERGEELQVEHKEQDKKKDRGMGY